ncbi:UDP-glucosyltransferase 2 isoform X4 [Plutella xylostella]|nr:UDP-glucosyltransferase 2 isoform X4 [Plutella xylostella]
MTRVYFVLLILNGSAVFQSVHAARMLCIYPVPFHSHQAVFQVMTEALAAEGHELVVLTPLPHEKPIPNVTEIDVHDISYKLWEDGYGEYQKTHEFTADPVTFWEEAVTPIMHGIVDAQMSSPGMQALIQDQNQQFDVILVEPVVPLSIMIAARFDAPVILVSSFFGGDDSFLTIGAPIHPIYFPEFNMQRIGNMTFWERVKQIYTTLRLRWMERSFKDKENAMIRKHFGKDAPTITELMKRVEMLFLNVHPIWDNNRPVPPSVVYMGALHLRNPKPIPKDLQSYLDASKNGVVYMSLGSKIRFSDLPEGTMQVFLNVFASLPYDVLIKWNGGELKNKPANVRLEKWLPQNDMLHHPKIKVFLMQGGLQSTDEAIAANVPLIGFPVFGDQFYNAQMFMKLDIGRQLDIKTINEQDLRQAILDVAENERYRRNIASLSLVLQEQRAGGLQRAVRGAARVAARAARPLRSPLADASLAQTLMLDVLVAVATGAVVTTVGTAVLALLLYRAVRRAVGTQPKLKSK